MKSSSKYTAIYELLDGAGYELEGSVIWQRNRWRVKVWHGAKLYRLAMTGAYSEREAFEGKIKEFIAKNETGTK